MRASTARPEMLDTLRREVGAFTGTPMRDDDCTMLALRRPAPQLPLSGVEPPGDY